MSDAVPPPPPSSSDGAPPPPPPAGGQTPPPPGSVPPPPADAPPPYQDAPPPYQPAAYQQAAQAPAPYGQAPSFNPSGGLEAGKPPRPQVKVGAILVIVGSLIAILGTFLPWADLGNETGNGFDYYLFRDGFDVIELDSPGIVVLFFVVALAGLGIALFFAGRVLAVAIIAIVLATIAAIVGLVMLGLMGAVTDDVGGDIGFGVVLTLIGPLVALAGAITATAKRRRWS